VFQAFVVDTAFQDPALGIPVMGTVAMAALAVHGSLDGLSSAFILLEPSLLLEPGDYFCSRFAIEWHSTNRARAAIQTTGGDFDMIISRMNSALFHGCSILQT